VKIKGSYIKFRIEFEQKMIDKLQQDIWDWQAEIITTGARKAIRKNRRRNKRWGINDQARRTGN
jgi:hypothetical protein